MSDHRSDLKATHLLTVAIPTFNRNSILQNNLESLLPQLTDKCKLMILDNHSEVPVSDTLAGLIAKFPKVDVEIIRHSINVGLGANLCRCFELVASEWLWILGDDDPVRPDAIQRVLGALEPGLCSIIFPIPGQPLVEEVRTVGVSEYLRKIPFGTGIFISSNIYHITRSFRDAIGIGYHYSYTYAPHYVMLLSILGDSGKCLFSTQALVNHMVPSREQKWFVLAGFLGFPLILDCLFLDHVHRKLLAQSIIDQQGQMRVLLYELLALARAKQSSYEALFLWERSFSRFAGVRLPLRLVFLRLIGKVLLRVPRFAHALFANYRWLRGLAPLEELTPQQFEKRL